MLQKINIEATNALVLKGIKDLSDMLYRQTDIKPESYLPILQYLWNFAKPMMQNKESENKELNQKTIVECINSEVCTAIKKVKLMLYKQTTIRPEVYLILFGQLDKYNTQLENQEKYGTNEPLQTQTEQKIEDKEKTNNLNLSNLKKMI